MTCLDVAHRQFRRSPKPLLQVAGFAAVEDLATQVQRRVREMLRARQAGTVVACDPAGGVYLLMEREMRTEQFFAEHLDWVVGVYASVPACGAPASVPELAVLVEDLQHHLAAQGACLGAPLNARAIGA